MKQKTLSYLICLSLILTAFGGVLIRNFAEGAPAYPNCSKCGCKEVYAWRPNDRGEWTTLYSVGYKKSNGMGEFTAVQNAELFVWSGACPDANTKKNDEPTIFKFHYFNIATVCQLPSMEPFAALEVSPSDLGEQVDFAGSKRSKCIKE